MNTIEAISVLDGRYRKLTQELSATFSEYGLIRHRVIVEVKWLVYLLQELRLGQVKDSDLTAIQAIATTFDINGAQKIKEIERTTNHDVKAVEYYLKDQLSAMDLGAIKELVHFACTSDDINNTAYALMLKEGRNTILKHYDSVLTAIEFLAKRYQSVPMMARTHGQPATPTTMGKELVNFAWRLQREREKLAKVAIQAKMNGATGNFNAHAFVTPNIDWINASQAFLTEYLELEPLIFTTQINPCNYIAELLQVMIRSASVIIDLDRDLWGYISLGYFKQKVQDNEVGSSTMPHKVNPIDFENSEGNMGVAISLMSHLSVKLLKSRFQRDLTDSTVLRNMGSVLGYFIIGLKNTLKGLGKVELNQDAILQDLNANLELLAEPIQTAMRFFGEKDPYEKLKRLTRGKRITEADLTTFIDSLEIVPQEMKNKMRRLTPSTYIGLAEALVTEYFQQKSTRD